MSFKFLRPFGSKRLRESYVFSTVQRYGDFRIPTIPMMWHFIYQEYGTNIKAANRTYCLSATYAKMRAQKEFYSAAATTSISTNAPFGKVLTATAERAG